MKKKFVYLVAIVLLITLVFAFSGCNKFKWDTISGGDASADVLSNGGYVVKQGNHVYFLNGFSGTSVDNNSFGAVSKQGSMRATLADDGALVEESFKLVVPKHIYTADTKSGFAIYGKWIYYATFNYDKDRGGKPSTTNLDFMRTKIDGSVTQKIYTIGQRSYPYIFTPTRILYYASNNIYAIDFTNMREDKSIDNGAGASRYILAQGVSSYAWVYNKVYDPTKKDISEYVLYTRATSTEEHAYRYTNELVVKKVDGQDETILAKHDTYDTDYKLNIVKMVAEGNDQLTLFYTKTKVAGTAETVVGLFVNKISTVNLDFNTTQEKQLSVSEQTDIFPISYEMGALITNSDDEFVYYVDTKGDPADTFEKKIVGRSGIKVQFVEKENDFYYVYYTASSSADKLFRINLIAEEGVSANETLVLKAGRMKVDWTALDFIRYGNNFDLFFFNEDDYGYLYRANIAETDSVIDEGEFWGKYTKADLEAKEKENEEDIYY